MSGPDVDLVAAAGAGFDVEASVARSGELARQLADAPPDSAPALVREWDAAMREVSTWATSQSIRFRCDTRDAEAKRGKEAADAAAPRLAEARRVFLDALLGPGGEPSVARAVREEFGAVVVDRWACELRSFEPRIGELLAREQRLKSEHMALVGGATVDFEGRTCTLQELHAFAFRGERELRRRAAEARWGWFAEHREELDDLFGRLVACRDELARGLGRATFTEVGYDRMRRTDYDVEDVARFRESVVQHVVPVATRLRAEQRERLGLDRLHVYDEVPWAPGPEPEPGGDATWQQERAAELFDAIDAAHGTRLGTLYGEMRARSLFDLVSRPGKGPGGFCAFLDRGRLPFVFANFDGTSGDARVFTHEMGHAYQGWCSDANLELVDQRRCTSESAEVHSMSLEFLTAPSMERFFGDAAPRYRTSHRARAVLFLPYGCAIDHFQHEVYAHPGWTPAERHDAWRRMEARYLPSRSWDGIEHGERGGAWQAQLHVYQYPFYYVDYVLAQLVALQFAALAEHDSPGAWTRYQRLCDLGGSRAFRELVRDAGLEDPFTDDVVRRTVGAALRA